MIKLFAVAAFALAVATSAQAITVAPLRSSDGLITQVRQNCDWFDTSLQPALARS